jgi:hypothetical protein
MEEEIQEKSKRELSIEAALKRERKRKIINRSLWIAFAVLVVAAIIKYMR